MNNFAETSEGLSFISSGDSRETSPEIMRAIAKLSQNELEAVRIWECVGTTDQLPGVIEVWEIVTSNGVRSSREYVWGAAGKLWAVL